MKTAAQRDQYQARVEALRTTVLHRLAAQPLHDPALMPADFLFCRASQRHFLPEHPAAPEAFFEDVVLYRDWAGMDEQLDLIPSLTQFTGDTSFLADVRERPRIFCTFHLGSYRSVLQYLWQHGVDLTLVVDHHVYTEQGPQFRQGHAGHPVYSQTDFRIIDAEQRSSGVQMLRELKAGRSLLFYIDGNTGVGGMGRQDEKMALIDFLGRRIFARKGVAFLSHLAGVPIVPLVAFRHDDTEFETHFFPPLLPNPAQNRDAYAVEATQEIFRLFEPVLRRFPEQWEGWLYLHHFADVSCLAAPAEEAPAFDLSQAEHLHFNEARYTLFWQDKQPFLFDDETYEAFRISAQLTEVLQSLTYQGLAFKRSLAAAAIFPELLQRQVLTVLEPAACPL